MLNKVKKKIFKKVLPILFGIVLLSLVCFILFTTVFKKSVEENQDILFIYQQQFSSIFLDEQDNIYGPAPFLEPVYNGSNLDYYKAQNKSFATIIPAGSYKNPFVFERKGYELSIIPKKAEDKIGETAYYRIPTIFPTANAQSSQVYYLIYKDVYQSTDIIKKMRPYGVKETIILKDEQAPTQFEFALNVSDNVEAKKESDNSIRFYKKLTGTETSGNISGLSSTEPDYFLFRIPPPFMIDINGKKSLDCEWQLSKIDSMHYDLILACDTFGLSYPLAIDPSIVDTYDDEDMIAAKSDAEITSGHAQLEATADWYNTSWDYRKKITINSTVVSESDAGETNFPVMINIASDSDLASDPRSDGYDILFTSSNGETKIDHEIELYDDSEGDLVAWVETPSLSSTSDTYLYMYYGNSSAADQQNASGTWDSNFIMVQHMDDDTTASVSESSGNSNDGLKLAANEPIVTVTEGTLGQSQKFDNNDDYVNVPHDSSLNTVNTMTISAWINKVSNDESAYDTIIAKGDETPSEFNYVLSTYEDELDFFYADGTYAEEVTTAANLGTSTWYYVAVTYEYNVDIIFYVNAAIEPDSDQAHDDAQLPNNTHDLRIGDAINYSSPFHGIIDEIRVSNSVRSAYWISNEHNNIASSSAFFGLGSEEYQYTSSGTVTSTNLLSETQNQTIDSIDSFYYNASSLPAGTELEVQFSQNNSDWYSATNSADWTMCDTADGETIDLSALGWSGTNFYYKFNFNSTSFRDSSPIVEDVKVNYSSAFSTRLRAGNGLRLRGGVRLR